MFARTGIVMVLLAGPLAAQSPAEKRQTVEFLQNLAGQQGGYMAVPTFSRERPAPTLRATSGVVRSLPKFGGESTNSEDDRSFVASCFDSTTGGFTERPGGTPDVVSTAIGLMTIVELKMPRERYQKPGLKFLDERVKTTEDIRIAAAALESLGAKSAKAGEWLTTVNADRKPDGTFGEGDSAARMTGGTAALILRLGGDLPFRANMLKVMNAGQLVDGGFGQTNQLGGTATSDLDSTYRVMRAYAMMKERPTNPAAVRQLVGKCRNTDGGYGTSPGAGSTASGTYYAGFLLAWLDAK